MILLWISRLAFLAVGGLFSALALARLARRGRELPVPIVLPQPLLLVAALLFLLMPRVLQPLLPADPNPAHPWSLAPVALALGGALLTLFLLAPRPRWFLPREERPSLRYALNAYLAALPVLIGILLVWLEIGRSAGFSARHEIVRGFGELAPFPAAGTLVITILLMPMLEEMVFRGWLFAGLASDRRTGPLLALAISSLAFGLSHAPPMWLT
ncbi:MAG: CPBP family intramembrane metalloprotease, partial [Planctomycetota bacterium]|nr:CPBP family intramembrane metalloprotease [Planctomycetota bacterium]